MNKRFLITTLFLIFIAGSAMNSQISERYKLTFQNNKMTFDHLVFGVDPAATWRIDSALGELQIPPIAIPPSGLNAIFEIWDSTYMDDAWGYDYSYKDFKPVPENQDSVDYRFEVFDDGLGYSIRWQKLSDNIDSAILIDNPTHGAATFVNMKDSFSVNITNPSLTVFHIKLWYNTNTGVVQTQEITQPFLNIFPVPCYDKLNIDLKISDIYNISVINEFGQKIKEEKIQGSHGSLNLEMIESGLYFLIVTNNEGFKSIMKFAKI